MRKGISIIALLTAIASVGAATVLGHGGLGGPVAAASARQSSAEQLPPFPDAFGSSGGSTGAALGAPAPAASFGDGTAPLPAGGYGESGGSGKHLRSAITALNGAIAELKAAPHDFGGHRAEAVEACERAVEQLKVALAYDKRGGH